MKLSEYERSVEITRRVLTDSVDYEPILIFKKLDTENKNYICPKNIMNFMSQKNINIFLEEAKFIIFFYDKDKDGFLSYDELTNLIQSQNPKSLNKKHSNNYITNKELSYSIEFSFYKLMEKEILLVQKMMGYLSDLNLGKFDLHDIYHEMKSLNINGITKESLKNFLERNNMSFLDSDANFIFNKLDVNKDGKIDFFEFHSFFGFPNCLYAWNSDICSFCGTKCCDECLSGINGYINYNLKEEHIYSKNNTVFHHNKNTEYEIDEKISKSLNLRLSPERKYAPIEIDINDIIYNNKENINVIKPDNNIDSEMISDSLSLRFGPQRKYAPFEVELNDINTKYESKEKITEKDIINFNNYLKILIEGESEIESHKVDLALKQDFNCEDFFRLFEFEGEGYISQEDLNNGLNILNIKSNEHITNLLMNRFDLLKETKLNYGDFFDMIVSYQRSYRNEIEKRIPLSKNPEDILNLINQKTLSCFKALMISIIEFEHRINNIRKKINLKENKIKQLFRTIDENKKGVLNYDDIIKYIIKNNIYFESQLGIDLLFIRLDKRRKGILFLDNILDEFNII